MLLLAALWNVDTRFHWNMEFRLVCDHKRPIALFQPAVVLVRKFLPDQSYQLVPIPVTKRGAKTGVGSRGRGRARGRGSSSNPRGRGRARGRGRGPPISDAAAPAALEDKAPSTDEAASESDLNGSSVSSVSSSSTSSSTEAEKDLLNGGSS